jgi:hypothetical protein
VRESRTRAEEIRKLLTSSAEYRSKAQFTMYFCLDKLNGELAVYYSPGPFLVLLWACKEVRKCRFSGDIYNKTNAKHSLIQIKIIMPEIKAAN